jgi:transcriptional pleiotropic regulator of transition state genes
VVIPKELRRTMDLPESTPMEFFTEADTIVMRKYAPGCVFCGSTSNLVNLHGKNVCGHCREDMKKLRR